MDITHIEEFLELARCLNFTETAKKLHLTQSAISKHISALEKELKVLLFKRSRQKVSLTEAGRAFYKRALLISENHQALLSEIAELRVSPALHVGGLIQNQEIALLLSLALKTLRKTDQRQVSIIPVVSGQYIPLLLSGEIDLCISTPSDEILANEDIVYELLYEDRFVAVVDNGHPLASKSTARLDELSQETFLQLVNDYSLSAWFCIEQACRKAGFTPKKNPNVIEDPLEYTTFPIGKTVYIVPEINLSQSVLNSDDALTHITLTDDFAVFPIGVACTKNQHDNLSDFLAALHQASDLMVQDIRRNANRPAPFRRRCEKIASNHKLSPLESQLLILYAKGNSNERIAATMELETGELSKRLTYVFDKLRISNRQQLIDLIDGGVTSDTHFDTQKAPKARRLQIRESRAFESWMPICRPHSWA